ncbi:hypothetical protein Pelo_6275 [Pelomyxa schiedti]|nr:hypothetical protein Pelo_6275 [Pelomyxa schiedti]
MGSTGSREHQPSEVDESAASTTIGTDEADQPKPPSLQEEGDCCGGSRNAAAALRTCGCWLCYRPFAAVGETRDPSVRMECGHNLCWECMVSLCTQEFLAPSGRRKHVGAPTGEEDEDIVEIECGVCRQGTAINVRDLMDDVVNTYTDEACTDKGSSDNSGPCSTGAKLGPRKEMCIFHSGQPLDKYCITDQCMVCSQCVEETHGNHDLTGIDTQAKNEKDNVGTLIRSVYNQKEMLEWIATGIEETLDSLTTKQRMVEEEIKQAFDRHMRELISELQRKKDALLSNTIKSFKQRKGALKLQLKCTRYAVEHFADTECALLRMKNQLEGGSIPPVSPNTEVSEDIEDVASFIALTNNRFLLNWNAPLDVSLMQGNFQISINRHPLKASLDSIYMTREGEDAFAMTTMRYLASGHFEKALQNCISMFPPSPFGPLDEIRTNQNPVPKEITMKSFNPNKFEALGIVLMILLFEMKPRLMHQLGPFDRDPLYTLRGKLRHASPESLYNIIHTVLSMSPRFTPSAATATSAGPPKYVDVHGDDVRVITLKALVHVIRGFINWKPIGDAEKDIVTAHSDWNRAVLMCEPRQHTGAAPSYVPRALAEYYLGRSSAITEDSTHYYTAAQLGHIGAASRAARLQIEQGLPPSGYIGHLMTASEGGNSWACCHLATLHETGCQGAGLRMDMAEAMRLYRIAADQGRGEAQHRLGALLIEDDSNETKQEGVRLLRLAKAQGSKEKDAKTKRECCE